jgi:hypothetical protein
MAFSLFRRGMSAEFDEARKPSVSPPTAGLVQRLGYVSGVPVDGATVTNPGQSSGDTTIDRSSFMGQLLRAYLACPHASACIDVTARTITAGGITPLPNTVVDSGGEIPDLPPDVQEVMDLLAFVNPQDDIRQLMRQVITDLMIFGDSFTEVVWLLGKPVALYSLDCQTMTIQSDEHGIVNGYHQEMSNGHTADFEPHEVIHVKFDSPDSGLYGASPTQKNILPITAWLFTAALVKETMKRGDPLRAWVDWPIALPESEQKRFQQQYQIRNLGARNIGNLIETKGGATLKEMAVNQLGEWMAIKQQSRDEIYTGYGVPPSKVSVIEAGNLGAGTGTSQDRGFQVNLCGPIGELVMEKFTFALLYQAYDITDWHLGFGTVDWRDDLIIEQIADLRIRNGSWSTNKRRAIIGEAPIQGGDDAFIVDRAAMVLYEDLNEYSKASVQAITAKSSQQAMGTAGNNGPSGASVPGGQGSTTAPVAGGVNLPNGKPATGGGSGSAESVDEGIYYSRGLWSPDQEADELEAVWRRAYQIRREEVLSDLDS